MTDVPCLPRPTGTILAGGLSRRMFEAATAADAGIRDKGLLQLAGMTMLERVIDRVRPQVAGLCLNANGDPARFARLRLPIVPDPIDGFVGPLAGVLAGLRWTAAVHPEAAHTLTVSSDAPFVPTTLVEAFSHILAGSRDAIALARSADGLHPVIGLWPVALADDLEAALRAGVRKVLAWTDRHTVRIADFGPVQIGPANIDPFFNANTPAEFAAAQRLLSTFDVGK